jgi:biopolymer transport protein TolR
MAMQVGGGGDFASDINVTPLVDVMLVLLVIFMITAPMLNTGVDIDLPETQAQEIQEKDEKTLILSVDLNKRLFLDGNPVLWAELPDKLQYNDKLVQQKQATGKTTLFVEGQKDVAYGVVVTAMAVAKHAGVDRVLLVTDPSVQVPLGELDQAAAAQAPNAPAPLPAGDQPE